MPTCEDYPCCGHEPNDCPDENGQFTCVLCKRLLPVNNHSSICNSCQNRNENSGFPEDTHDLWDDYD